MSESVDVVRDALFDDLVLRIKKDAEQRIVDGAGEFTPRKQYRKLYEIVSANNVESLSKAVEKRLEDGWKLSGGVAVEVIHHEEGYHLETNFHQAVTIKAVATA